MAHNTETPAGIASITALLKVPEHNALSAEQVRGARCVWCDKLLTAETAVDLPERRIRSLGTHIDTFPRAHRACVGKRAYSALLDHAPCCEQCVDNSAECETGRELQRLARLVRS